MIRIMLCALLVAVFAMAWACTAADDDDNDNDAADADDDSNTDDDNAAADDDGNCIACDSTGECTDALGPGWVCTGGCCVDLGDDDDDDTIDDDDDTGDDDDDTPMPYWSDAATGLKWPRGMYTAYPGVTYAEAEAFCQSFTLGDLFVYWRLPTIDELRSLVRGCPGTVTDGECPLSEECSDIDECYTADCTGCAIGEGPGPSGFYWPDEMTGDADYQWVWPASPMLNNTGRAIISYGDASVFYTEESMQVQTICVNDH